MHNTLHTNLPKFISVAYCHVVYQHPRPTQPPTLSRMGNEYWTKCIDTLQQGVKASMTCSICRLHVWMADKPVKTHTIPKQLIDEPLHRTTTQIYRHHFITFCIRHSRSEMYSSHGCLCICLSIPRHGPGCNLGEW